jgi:Flp pilus assembly protein TadB
MGARLKNSKLTVLVVAVAALVAGVAMWSWLPASSRDWLALAGAAGLFWVVWESCIAPSGDNKPER